MAEARPVLPIRSDVQALAQRKNAKQAAEDEKKSISELPVQEQYPRLLENIGNIGGEGEFLGGEGTRSLGDFVGNVQSDFVDWSGDVLALVGKGPKASTQQVASAGQANVPEPIIDQLEVEQFASQTQTQLDRVSQRMTLFEKLYTEQLSPEARTALDEAYGVAVQEVDELNEQITNRLAQLQAGQELLGVDAATGQVAVSDVDAAGLVPGVGGSAGRSGESTLPTPEQEALGGVFERATARALETQPNVQGTSGPFTFVRGGAESDKQRAMQEQMIRDFIGETDEIVTKGSGGQNISSQADSLAQRAAAAQVDALKLQDQGARMDMQLAFEQAIRQDIDNLVQQRQDVTDQFDQIESALQEEDLAQGAQKFALGFDPTPEGAYLDAFETGMDEFLTKAGFEETQPGQFDEIMELSTTIAALDDGTIELLRSGVGDTANGLNGLQAAGGDADPAQLQAAMQVEQALNTVARKHDLDPTALKNEAIRSRAKASRIFQDIQSLGSTKKVEPGSHSAAYLIYQEAAPRLGDEAAQALANSPAMHQLIKVASGGRVGLEKGGNLAGIAGLSRDTYEKGLGLDYESIRGDAYAEMGALIDYLMVAYGGDPVAALTAVRDEKAWGRLPGEAGNNNQRVRGDR